MDLIDDPSPGGNRPEFTVSEIAGAVKRVIEGEFGLVRVRGEVGRVSRPVSGHLYFNLKDDKSSLDAVVWKGQAPRLGVRPEEGIEVIATGRLTTFPGGSKYQMIVDDLAPAGAGALMVMLERRRAALAAEGLFDPARKQPIPFLPRVVGVVTSPSGAVIRDILHRLRDRFPRHVLVWPVPVQGDRCAPEVAAAIRGFNAIVAGGPVPRPDVIIVARGGGSVEDLWGYNEEIVVRAAAASAIPLISAVGHETDTTLIDHAADLRAPTPTAAAELAVPVRADLVAQLAALAARQQRAAAQGLQGRAQRLRDLARALPRPEAMVQGAAQRLDTAAARLSAALRLSVAARRGRFDRVAARVQPGALAALLARRADRVQSLAARLEGARARAVAAEARRVAEGRRQLALLAGRLDAAPAARLAALADRLDRLDRLRQTLGWRETLARGFAVVRGDGALVTTRAAAERAAALEIEFADGRLVPGAPRPPRKPRAPDRGQGSLF
jgi:exodeoxyribonuclease VII large subunit